MNQTRSKFIPSCLFLLLSSFPISSVFPLEDSFNSNDEKAVGAASCSFGENVSSEAEEHSFAYGKSDETESSDNEDQVNNTDSSAASILPINLEVRYTRSISFNKAFAKTIFLICRKICRRDANGTKHAACSCELDSHVCRDLTIGDNYHCYCRCPLTHQEHTESQYCFAGSKRHYSLCKCGRVVCFHEHVFDSNGRCTKCNYIKL